jgi:ABC-type amino acid transport substrate-binding protein/heat shock protein HslJ
MEKKNTNTVVLVIIAILAVGLICILGWMLFNTLFGEEQAPVYTPLPPAETPLSSPAADNSWALVQGSGRLVAGTSADYPPFAYYNAGYALDGFDVALIRAIAQRLGVQVDVQDYAFDGLPSALQIGQINVAIAAISVTPERQQQLGFGSIYYSGQEGMLAGQNSAINSIPSVDALAPYRVGVQAGSVYETWLRTSLVDTGKMPAANLLVYPRIDGALIDVKEGRIDIVVLDLLPAQDFLKQGGLKLVGQGLSQQSFAIALPLASIALRDQINRALGELVTDGTLAALYQQYGLNSTGVIPVPTPTPAPQPTATLPPPPCVDGMVLVQQLNLDDHNMAAPPLMAPGQSFSKGWRIRNTGTCTWNSSYRLVYVQGNTPQAQMGGQPTPIQGQVLPNQTYDMYVNLVAPLTPGIYQGIWQMVNGQNVAFGQRVSVGIQVLAPVTPTPGAAAPVIYRFLVDTNRIYTGECVNLQWQVQGSVNLIRLLRNNAEIWNGAPLSGSYRDCPPGAGQMTYTLEASGPGGTTRAQQVVSVIQPTATLPPATPTTIPAPVINQFSVTPSQIQAGACVTISWSTGGGTTRVRLLRNGAAVLDNAPFNGNESDCPNQAGTVQYRLEAYNAAGQSTYQDASVNVTQPPPTNPLLGTSWLLLYYNNGQGGLVSPLAGTTVSLSFMSDTALSGSSGCNNYQSSYNVSGTQISIGGIVGGQVFCGSPEGIMEQEQQYLGLLANAATYQLNGSGVNATLDLYNASGQRILSYQNAISPR